MYSSDCGKTYKILQIYNTAIGSWEKIEKIKNITSNNCIVVKVFPTYSKS